MDTDGNKLAESRTYYGNVGDIRNSGVELSLQGALIRTKDIDWSIQMNLAHNKDKILKLPESKTTDFGGFIDGGIWYKEGGSIYNSFRAELMSREKPFIM